jgi:hypothetical protein
MVCSVSDRITQSKEPSPKSERPLSRSTCRTLTSFATHSSTARVVDLDAVAGRLALLPEVAQERAVAAAQVQHARAGGDPVGDGGLVGPHSSMLEK